MSPKNLLVAGLVTTVVGLIGAFGVWRCGQIFRPLFELVSLRIEPRSAIEKRAQPVPAPVATITVKTSSLNDDLIGSTYETDDAVSPRLGVYFLNEYQAYVLANGRKAGATCSYTRQGNHIHVVTSCNPMELTLEGNDLFDSQFVNPLHKK